MPKAPRPLRDVGKGASRQDRLQAVLARLAPRIPAFEAGCVIDHALASPGLRHASPEESVWLSLVAYVRHALTDYDDMLAEGYDADAARYAVAAEMTAILAEWGVRRPL